MRRNLVTKKEIINSFENEDYTVLSIERGVSMSHSVVNFMCPEGHKHKVIYTNWKHKKTRCAHCMGNARHKLEYIREEFAAEGYKLLTKHYENNRQKLDFICRNGHRSSMCYDKWNNKHRCRRCYNERQSLELCGANNNAWKGGISCEPYCDVWLDDSYKKSIKERDGNKCVNPFCSGISNLLNIHHIDYNKKNCAPNNLITLCVSCNAKANFDRVWHESWCKVIIFRRYTEGLK